MSAMLVGAGVMGTLGLLEYMNQQEQKKHHQDVAQYTAAGIGFHGQRPAAVREPSLWDTFGGGIMSGATMGYYASQLPAGADAAPPTPEPAPAAAGALPAPMDVPNPDPDKMGMQPGSGYYDVREQPIAYDQPNLNSGYQGMGHLAGPPSPGDPIYGPNQPRQYIPPSSAYFNMPSQEEIYQRDTQSGYFTEPYRAREGY